MFRVLKMWASVPVVMACALGGTIVLIKAIERLSPNREAPRSSAEAGKK